MMICLYWPFYPTKKTPEDQHFKAICCTKSEFETSLAYYRLCFKKVSSGAREMAQPLRTPAVLPKDLAQFLVPTWQLTTVCNSSSRGSHGLSDLLEHQIYMWFTDIHEDKQLYA